MKKLTFLIVVAIFASSSAIAQIQRNSLLEVFTSSTCPPCVPANVNFENVVPTINNYTIIKWQMSWPGAGDPYYTSEGGARRSFFSVNSVPKMYIDGTWGQHAGQFTKNVFQNYNSQPAHVEFTFNETYYDASNNMVTIDFDVTADQDYSAGYRVMVAIVEGETTGNIGSNGETEFYNVFHANLPSPGGTMLSSGLKKDEPKNIKLSRDMTTTNMEELTDLKVVVWMEHISTKAVENSDWQEIYSKAIVGVEKEEVFEDLNIYPNPSNGFASIQFDLTQSTDVQISVHDITGKVVKNYPRNTYASGNHMIDFDGSELPAGVYLVNFTTENNQITKKLMME